MISLVKDGMVNSIMCKYSSDFIIKYRDSSISQNEKYKFELHILNCEICRSLVALDKEFIEFLKDDSTAKKLRINQVMSNIDLNKYNSGRGKVMSKLQKWKSNSIKIAVILLVVCGVGLFFSQIRPIREGFKTVSLSILDKQARLNNKDTTSSRDKSGPDSIQPSSQVSNIPINKIKTTEDFNNTFGYTLNILSTPQISLETDQKIANEDPIHATIDFINLKASKGELDITGKVEDEDLEIIQKTDEDILIEVKGGKIEIDRIYLRRLVGKDNVGVWVIVGYDPLWIGSMRTVYVQGSVSSYDKVQNMVTLEVEKNIHKGTSPIDSQDSPFMIGAKETFRLIEPTEVNFDNTKHIIIAINKYSVENTSFYGGKIKYYEKDKKWLDISDAEVDYENIISR